jgi:threonine dehydratase
VIVGELTFEHARELIDDVITVDDDSIRRATSALVGDHKLIVEYSGAATTAAILSGRIAVEGLRVAAVASGGNLDPSILAELF